MTWLRLKNTGLQGMSEVRRANPYSAKEHSDAILKSALLFIPSSVDFSTEMSLSIGIECSWPRVIREIMPLTRWNNDALKHTAR